MRHWQLAILCWLAGTAMAAAIDVRLKDIAAFAGVRENQLFGYGVVVGLEGTGDTTQNKFTFQTIANYMEKMGITIQPTDFQMRNTAAVVATATLPPFPRVGGHIDVTVSSIGSAKSIQGGVLLICPLLAPDGQVYAVAQGAISIGGFNASQGGASASKNHATVGRIANGALVEKEIDFNFMSQSYLTLVVNQDDFTTTTRVVDVINKNVGDIAAAIDSRTIRIMIPEAYQLKKVQLVSVLENLNVSPDAKARVVINERTGTVVFGEYVKVSKVALAHGGINITIKPDIQVSQPAPLSQGRTTTTSNPDVQVTEQKASIAMLDATATIGDVVKILNALGATTRDIIAILQAMKTAGALQAEVEVM
jgi:flagellar P-ring protein FlgI